MKCVFIQELNIMEHDRWNNSSYPNNGLFRLPSGMLMLRCETGPGTVPTINEVRGLSISHVIDGTAVQGTLPATPEFFGALISNKDKQISSLLELLKGAQEIILDIQRPA